MGALQVFVLVFFTFAYAYSIGKHGQIRKLGSMAGLLWGFSLCHALYYWGGFYTTFGWPQAGLLLTDAMALRLAVSFVERKRVVHYNMWFSIADYIWTFGCLWAGGFFSLGVPQI